MSQPSPAEVMLAATKTMLRSGRPLPAQVIARQLAALASAGYILQPQLADGGAALLLSTSKRALRSGRFRPSEVIAMQLESLAAGGYSFEFPEGGEPQSCTAFQWGPGTFQSCGECGRSYWQHGENGPRGSGTHRRQ